MLLRILLPWKIIAAISWNCNTLDARNTRWFELTLCTCDRLYQFLWSWFFHTQVKTQLWRHRGSYSSQDNALFCKLLSKNIAHSHAFEDGENCSDLKILFVNFPIFGGTVNNHTTKWQDKNETKRPIPLHVLLYLYMYNVRKYFCMFLESSCH